jgi:protein TorT
MVSRRKNRATRPATSLRGRGSTTEEEMMRKQLAAGLVAIAALWAIPGQTVLAEDEGNWTYDVKGGPDGNSTNMKWSNIEKSKITKPWRLCALFPQMKNVYWVAGSFGLMTEARRDNVNLQLFEAGGYGNLSTQLNQMDNCIASGYDAIIIAAISADGVAPLVRKAVAKGIPVIDYANGINEPATSAHATVSFIDLGKLAGQYVLDHTEPKSTVVGFFPGPQGANFSDDAVKGFEEAIKGSPLKVAVTRRGDASLNVQLDLVQNAMQAYPDINYIVAIDPGAQGAVTVLRNSRMLGKVKVIGINFIPAIYTDIQKGDTEGSGVDFTPIQAKLAVDMAVRLLEKQPLPAKFAGPTPAFITKQNIASFVWDTMFAPKDYKVTYTVDAK